MWKDDLNFLTKLYIHFIVVNQEEDGEGMLQGDSLHLQGLWQLSSSISTQQLMPSVHLVIKRLEETKHQRIKSDITSSFSTGK